MANPLFLLRYHHLFSAKLKTIIRVSLLCLFGEMTLPLSPFLLPNIVDSCFLFDTKNFQSNTLVINLYQKLRNVIEMEGILSE